MRHSYAFRILRSAVSHSTIKSWLLLIIFSSGCLTGQGQWQTSGNNIYTTNSGYVGIGTSTPGSQLEMITQYVADGLTIRYTGAAGFVRLTGNNFAATYLNPITMSGDAGLIYGGSSVDAITTGLVIAPYKSSLSGLRIDNNGNVGIKTNNTQGYQLAVNGAAIFTSARVKAYANWPDFVFAPDYHLSPLDSLSNYVQTNRHLPGFPSADSVQAAGMDIGGTEAALLKKIEELTLYLIEQNKTLKEQQAEIDRLNRLIGRKNKD